ncbi:hypothetical protein [Catenulispora pinisilvae]|uniref:hypothetical protein n=1 Tax=Catenulispora pinisilvae TaxID=2705253 RepID=UPI00189156E3|nr:hypothetical protein [Catenulispora pinisilvae]
MSGSGDNNGNGKSGNSDSGSGVSADHEAINALGQMLLSSLTGADTTAGSGAAGKELFVTLPAAIGQPVGSGGLGLTAQTYSQDGDGTVAQNGVGLLPGFCQDGSYYKNAYQAKLKYNTQIAVALSLLQTGKLNNVTLSIYDMVKDLANGLINAATEYANGEQVAYTDLTSLESELGVTAPTPPPPKL